MIKRIKYLILPAFTLLLIGCNRSSVEVLKAEYAEHIVYVGGVAVTYTGKHIISMTLDFHFKTLNTKEKSGSDAYKSEVYKILAQNARFYIGDSLLGYTYGYWPEKITNTSASDMVMYYVIPDNTDISKLRFEYNTSILNGIPDNYVYTKFSKMKPIEKQ